jgi:hypothetical protein
MISAIFQIRDDMTSALIPSYNNNLPFFIQDKNNTFIVLHRENEEEITLTVSDIVMQINEHVENVLKNMLSNNEIDDYGIWVRGNINEVIVWKGETYPIDFPKFLEDRIRFIHHEYNEIEFSIETILDKFDVIRVEFE